MRPIADPANSWRLPPKGNLLSHYGRKLIVAAIACTACSAETFSANEFVEISYRGTKAMAELRGGELYLEGDIRVSPTDLDETDVQSSPNHPNETRRKAIARRNGSSYKWGGPSNGRENYVIHYSKKSTSALSTTITTALGWWNRAVPQLEFSELSSCSGDCIDFVIATDPNIGGSSYVGRIGGTQQIALASGASAGVAAHEIGHALGLWHEQSRADRDNFVTVNFSNIKGGYAANFDKAGKNGFDFLSYDYDSIMHYDAFAFSKNGKQTISAIGTLPQGVFLGQRNHLSVNDIAGMKAMYPTMDMNDIAFSLGSYPLVSLSGREFLGPGPTTDFNVDYACTVTQGAETHKITGSGLDASILSGPGTYLSTCSISSHFWERWNGSEEVWSGSNQLTVLSAGLIPVLFGT